MELVLINPSNLNISWISIARSISVVSIIIFHIYMGKFRYIFYEGTNAFFAISGYVIATSLMRQNFISRGDWLSWWKRRLLRLYPLWLIVLFISFICFILNITWISLGISSINTIVDFILHAFMLHVYSSSTYYSINIAWWFQGIIIQCYLMTPLLYFIVRSRYSGISLVLISWATYIGANVILRSIPQSSNLLVIYLGQAAFGWLWYLMGMIYASRESGTFFISSKSLKWALPLLIACVLYIFCFHSILSALETIGAKKIVFSVLASVSTVYIIITLSQWLTEFYDTKKILKYIPSSLAWFGSCSYPAYLTHMFFVPILALPTSWFLRVAAYFTTVLIVSYVLTLTEKKMKWFLENKVI